MDAVIRFIEGLLDAAGRDPTILHYALLGLAATVEYVFPPFPGDVIVLFGAFLVGHSGWSGPGVFAAVCVGSLAGLSADYAFGRWVGRHDASWRERSAAWRRMGASIDRFGAFYARWGPLCIVLNRFLPAIRAAFFVAAGMCRIAWWKVLVLGLLSAAAWNALIFWVGVALGHNWERMEAFLRTYSTVVWCLLAAAALVALSVRLARRCRAAS